LFCCRFSPCPFPILPLSLQEWPVSLSLPSVCWWFFSSSPPSFSPPRYKAGRPVFLQTPLPNNYVCRIPIFSLTAIFSLYVRRNLQGQSPPSEFRRGSFLLLSPPFPRIHKINHSFLPQPTPLRLQGVLLGFGFSCLPIANAHAVFSIVGTTLSVPLMLR